MFNEKGGIHSSLKRIFTIFSCISFQSFFLTYSLFFKFFLFCIVVQPINSVVIVSGEQWKDSALHIHVSILPQTHLPFRLPHNIEQRFLCYTGGSWWLAILNIAISHRILNRTLKKWSPSLATNALDLVLSDRHFEWLSSFSKVSSIVKIQTFHNPVHHHPTL